LEIGAFAASLAALAAVAAVPGAAGSPAAARGALVTCAFSPATATMTVTAAEVVASIQRRGDELQVFSGTSPVACEGGAPTVFTVDTIRVAASTEVALDLRRGRLAPGATDEGGGSEIEVVARFERTGGLRVRASAGNDAIRLGEVGNEHGVNLNAREPQPDADVSVSGGYNVVSVLGRRGNDLISAAGGRGFDAPLDTRITVSAGGGRDRVIGSSRADLLGGGAGPDRIKAGAGFDRIRSHGGADTLRVRDGERDFVQCGPGDDGIKADRVDRISSCEIR
jgi:hypothetical protein